ncbi:MAG: hypothetical protein PHU97_08445 [Bacteroidales bacterium]|jgi:hypothetical protein|nr:hypothetical protein [Bacteroidales bacterium]MDD2322696.1 hypothetical protein [Bacteroidales bacterium]MDD3011331.1 hypothetical protein [Bacteroidales bacterium]MDD3961711.1 hypothetical protein [Bacteroidales bacterium]MDY0285298.1 hypothetical protein [Bacteroidales bacterium]
MKTTFSLSVFLFFCGVLFISPMAFASAVKSIDREVQQNPQKISVAITTQNQCSIVNYSTPVPLTDATIRVLNFKGDELKSKMDSNSPGKNSVTLEQFDAGLYFIDIKALNVNVTLPVIIK